MRPLVAVQAFLAAVMATQAEHSGRESFTAPLLSRHMRKLPLVDKRGGLNVETRGLPKTFLYWGDLFHTLVNMPNMRFFWLLFLSYFLLFVLFAIPFYYEAYNNFCIPGVQTFSHAIWFSVQTSMTIGYGGELTPDPRCMVTNSLVLIQSIASLVMAYSLLGVFYARFSRPTRRAQTLVFSRSMVLHEEDGVPVLCLRMANIRKHQVIEASVRMLVALNNTLTQEDESVFNFMNLPVIGGSQVFLGLPCLVKHPITATSPLYGLSIQAMEECDMEILVLLEGVDSSTSCKLQARHSYRPSDICLEARFETMVTRLPGGRRCVDFTKFDSVVPMTENLIIRPGLTPLTPSALSLPPFLHVPCPQQSAQGQAQDQDQDQEQQQEQEPQPPEPEQSEAASSEQPPALRLPSQDHPAHSHPRLRRSLSGGIDKTRLLEVDQRVAKAEAKAQLWKQMVVEMAVRVQQAMHQPAAAGTHVFAGPLLECSKQALQMALAPDPS